MLAFEAFDSWKFLMGTVLFIPLRRVNVSLLLSVCIVQFYLIYLIVRSCSLVVKIEIFAQEHVMTIADKIPN